MDLIKRSDAIQELGEYLMYEAQQEYAGTASEDIEDWKDLAEHILKDIPSFEPKYEITADQLAKLLREGWTIHSEPKRGRWEWNQYDGNPAIGNYHCSICRRLVPHDKYAFCPNCGSRMVK